ncbi:cysteine proteinase [Flammula alnicola]|nr:cysteine proteinase [Flammula alnicola]
MAKRNKLKKMTSPPQTTASTAPIMGQDDENLMNDLLAQLDSRDQTVQKESAHLINDLNTEQDATKLEASEKKDPKSRFKARQARKAAMLTQTYSPDDPATQARLEKEAKDEEDAIRRICKNLLLEVYEINPDGHCLFSAVADQLALLGILPADQASYANLRTAAANFIHSHPDEFLPFLPSAGGEDGEGALDAGLMTREQFDDYCTSVRDTATWGGEPEIVALSRAFNIPIHVVQGGQPPIVMHDPARGRSEHDVNAQRIVRISYHRKLYGLGEHYNSLRPRRQV